MSARLAKYLPDLVSLAGLVLIGAGVARWNVTAAIIYAGAVCLVMGAALAWLRKGRA